MQLQKKVKSNPKQPSCKKCVRLMAPNSPELSLLKILPLAYHNSHFLAATLDFTSFSQCSHWGRTHLFTAVLFWTRSILTEFN